MSAPAKVVHIRHKNVSKIIFFIGKCICRLLLRWSFTQNHLDDFNCKGGIIVSTMWYRVVT
jgi:hypothetical protein